MKLPMSWLRDWVEVDATPEQVAEALTRRGFYVEGIETLGRSYPGVAVARVLEVSRHPNADKLSLCRVDSGFGELAIVCGAPNVKAGMIVPLATIGTRLPGGLVIKQSRIRGVESQGMLCSADELGLSDDHTGIVDLVEFLGAGAGLVPGRPLDELMPPPDAVLEVEVPFNRPDGLGVVGLAREVRAAFGRPWTPAARERLAARWPAAGAAPAEFDLELEDREGCPRYIAQVVEGVRIAPSPAWLQRRLEAMGQRPINNVVDVTNLVLFELGQPLHAFDLDHLAGPAIRVRRARAGERMTTLDGRERGLDPEVLVIADRDGPVAIAGVMGGAASEVSEATTRLLLECAWFQPRRIRRGARALGLATEASRRFERGVDASGGAVATARFLALLAGVSPGLTLGAARERAYGPEPARPLVLRGTRCRRLIGLDLSVADATRHLEAMELPVGRRAPHGTPVPGAWELEVRVPGWRPDLTLEDDLVEEVARAHGYDLIPEARLETRGAYATRSPRERGIERARRAMLARGFSEAWTGTLVSEREAVDAAALLGDPPAALVRLANPMSREGEVLRPNLVAGLLRACAHNLRQGVPALRLFEIGAGFTTSGAAPVAGAAPTTGAAHPGGTAPVAAAALPDETLMLAAIVTGPRFAHAHDAAQQPVDFDEAKGLWEAWLEEMSVDTPEWRAYAASGWKPGASAEVAAGTSRIGWAGALGQPLLRAWDIEVPVHLFVVRLDPLFRGAPAARRVSLPGRFPPVSRDLAFHVPLGCTHHEVEQVLSRTAGERLATIELFDIYAGPGTPEGMKSLAYALRFEHPERTLQEAEIQALQERMVEAVARECGGRLRER
jgi:phenylalanyl-tRNA synthetase beta chain